MRSTSLAGFRFFGAILAVYLTLVGQASALTLGDITVNSAVGERFYAVVKLSDTRKTSADQILVTLAPRSIYQRMGVDWEYFHSGLIFDVLSDERNGIYLRIVSQDVVFEPFIDFVISVRWPTGFISKQYTVLLDMPVSNPSVASGNVSSVSSSGTIERTPLPDVSLDASNDEAFSSATTSTAESAAQVSAVPDIQPSVSTIDTPADAVIDSEPDKEAAGAEELLQNTQASIPEQPETVATAELIQPDIEPAGEASTPAQQETNFETLAPDEEAKVDSQAVTDQAVPVAEQAQPETEPEIEVETSTADFVREAEGAEAGEPAGIDEQAEINGQESIAETFGETVPETAIDQAAESEVVIEQEADDSQSLAIEQESAEETSVAEVAAVDTNTAETNTTESTAAEQQSWNIVSQRGDTLWAMARKIQAERGGRIIDIVNALFKNNAHAFMGNDANRLRVDAELTVSTAQIIAAAPVSRRGQVAELYQQSSGSVQAEPAKTANEGASAKSSPDGVLSLVARDTSKIAASPLTEKLSAELDESTEQLDQQIEKSALKTSAIEERMDNVLAQYEALSEKTEQLKELEENLNRRIAEKAQVDMGLATADLPQNPASLDDSTEQEKDAVWRLQLVALILALSAMVCFAFFLLQRHRLNSRGSYYDNKWDNDILGTKERHSDAELSELIKLKGEAVLRDDDAASDEMLVENEVSEGAVELQASLYIAYERYAEAEQLLQDAITQQPNNAALKSQLLEVYAAQGKQQEFDQLVEQLEKNTDAQLRNKSDTLKKEA